MASMRCTCGHVIRDQRDDLPYKARFISDRSDAEFTDWLVAEVDTYFAAVGAGTLENWLHDHGFGAGYPHLQLSHGQIILDRVTQFCIANTRLMYECEQCGKLWLQQRNGTFVGFAPETGTKADVLAPG